MSEQTDAQGETTFNPYDKHPHRKKVQRAKQKIPTPTKKLIVAIAPKGRKYVNIYERRYPRKHLPLGERNQVTIGEFVYKRSKGHLGLNGKWYKLHKGESVEDAIKKRGLEAVLVDSLPIEEKEGKHEDIQA